MTTDVQRRSQVYGLLTDGASRKIQLSGTDTALEYIREAYTLATTPPRLEPWASLAAYRLAHLLLRGKPDRKTLVEIDRLFAEAARQPLLGPYPHIYRLPVQQRLGATRPTLETIFRDALKSYDEHAREPTADGLPVRASIQTDLFALLDLAGYFLEIDRGGREGRGARREEAQGDAHWRIVGPERALADVLVSEDFALAELDSMAKARAPAFTFVLPANRDGARICASGAWKPLPHRAARLLACLLRGDARDHRELVERVMGGDGDTEVGNFRQVKRRLVTQLQALGVSQPADLVVEATGAPPRLEPGFVVLGAINESAYDDAER